MTIRSKNKHGKVDKTKELADDADVQVRLANKAKSPSQPRKAKRQAPPRTLAERLANVIGKAKGLPPDASVNHDHYLYGTPKKK